ncbi:MAG: glycosyltransferase [Burkholderiales bacterium]|nr:glycosyltransferase [Burkholderiales bacterium]
MKNDEQHDEEPASMGGGQRIVFIYGSLDMGGVETYILRLSNWLVSRGIAVTLLLVKPGKLDSLLLPAVVRVYGVTDNAVFLKKKGIPAEAEDALRSATILFALDPFSSFRTTALLSRSNPLARVAHGVFHPRIYFLHDPRPTGSDRLMKKLLQDVLEPSNLLFMNEACRASHGREFGLDFSNASVFPLPIAGVREVPCGARGRRIVSVGRLTSFKTYNLYMLDVVRELLDRGFHDVRWDVYGDGPMRPEMLKRVDELSLTGHVFMHGEIAYQQFSDAVCGAEVFVGMGTALIEAAAHGVVCVPAIDSANAKSYGYFHDLDGYSVGEHASAAPSIPVTELIVDIFNLDDWAYQALVAEEVARARQFDIETIGGRFLETTSRTQSVESHRRLPPSMRWRYATIVLMGTMAGFFSKAVAKGLRIVLPTSMWIRLREMNRRRHAVKNRSELSA